MSEAYRKGRSVENYIKHKLFDMGAKVVIRSAGSKGLFDLVAIFPKSEDIWLVQVKGSEENVHKKTRTEMAKFKGLYKVTPVIIRKKGRRYEIEKL